MKSPRSSPAAHGSPGDDRIIGRAFRWSLLGIVAASAVAGALIWWTASPDAEPQADAAVFIPPRLRDRPPVELPAVRFTDVTEEAGIDFVHTSGAYGAKLLPETLGGGCAFFDFTGDGRQDLLLVNSSYWPWERPAGAEDAPPPTLALYRNLGGGRFEDVTAASGLDVSLYGMGVAVGDFDNDGMVDVLISAVGENRLFRNNGDGTFTDVTARAGVAGGSNDWSTACGFFDYNGNGRLDLLVCNYVQWSREADLAQDFTLVGVGRAYGPPVLFPGTFPRLYRNEGDGRFTDVSAEAGIEITNPATGVPMAKSLGLAFIDFEGDGRLDVVVANDTVRNFLFHNQGDGTFREIGDVAGIGFDSSGNVRGAMGIDLAHYRNDDAVGIAIGNFANEMTALYVSQGAPLLFADEAVAAGLGPPTRLDLTFGLFFFDYDLNGRLDLLATNGHLEEEIEKVQGGQQYRQAARLFWNAGPEAASEFLNVTAEKCGPDLFTPIVGRGAAYADIDGDGALDVIFTQIDGPPLLLRNDGPHDADFLRFRLVGTRDNRDAIGAWVEVFCGDEMLRRQVMPTRSYLSQVELPVTVGLGRGRTIDRVQVRWPGGTVQQVTDYRLNALTVVEQDPLDELTW